MTASICALADYDSLVLVHGDEACGLFICSVSLHCILIRSSARLAALYFEMFSLLQGSRGFQFVPRYALQYRFDCLDSQG